MIATGARLRLGLIAGAMLLGFSAPPVLLGQTPADAPADTAFHAVTYVETRADAGKAAHAVLARYRDARRKEDSFVRAEFFEQIGRPGHFAAVETWRDQAAFDARDTGTDKQLLGALQNLRVSGYDQRPYKTLTVAATGSGAVGSSAAVATPPRGAVFVIAHVDVTPSPQVPVLLARLAETSRREAGNLRFDVLQHTMRANHFTVIEGWRSQEALDAHVSAPHTRQYRDELQPVTGSPLDERLYTSLD